VEVVWEKAYFRYFVNFWKVSETDDGAPLKVVGFKWVYARFTFVVDSLVWPTSSNLNYGLHSILEQVQIIDFSTDATRTSVIKAT
jgi:hypothetical protein